MYTALAHELRTIKQNKNKENLNKHYQPLSSNHFIHLQMQYNIKMSTVQTGSKQISASENAHIFMRRADYSSCRETNSSCPPRTPDPILHVGKHIHQCANRTDNIYTVQ